MRVLYIFKQNVDLCNYLRSDLLNCVISIDRDLETSPSINIDIRDFNYRDYIFDLIIINLPKFNIMKKTIYSKIFEILDFYTEDNPNISYLIRDSHISSHKFIKDRYPNYSNNVLIDICKYQNTCIKNTIRFYTNIKLYTNLCKDSCKYRIIKKNFHLENRCNGYIPLKLMEVILSKINIE